MPTAQKAAEVEGLAERLGRSQSVVLASFSGLSVAELSVLRGQVREAGGELRVVKNTLLGLAGERRSLTGLEPFLTGPTIAAFAYGDAVAPVKVLAQFGREHPDRWQVKGGILAGRVISAAEVGALASLPSREQLLGRLAVVTAQPITLVARVLAEPIARLARVLAAAAEQGAGHAA
jgi:large subunit ribosomal protein L10